MQCVSGIILEPGSEPFQGYLCWEDGMVVERGKGNPPNEPMATGIITPSFINGHTHIGDSCLTHRIDLVVGLEKIVNPPDGLKHRLLNTTPDGEIIRGMEESFYFMAGTGTRGFMDFREGGVQGLSLLGEAFRKVREDSTSSINPPTPYVFSRPRSLSYRKEEIEQLLDHSVGIGISAMADWDYAELEKIAAQVHGRGKLLSLHASETIREDIDRVLELKPDILVHLTSATPDDLERVADAEIQVVICPRANALFGFLPDIPLMLEKGLSLSLGTDNLMFTSPDLFKEMDFAWRIARFQAKTSTSIITPGDIHVMAGHRMRKALNVKSGVSQGEKANFMVLPSPVLEPGFATMSLIRGGNISLFVNGTSQPEVQ